MIRTQVQLTESQMKALRQLSAATGKSIADLVRQGVDRFLAANPAHDREQRVRRAIRAAGRFKSTASDVSARHDRYLAEAYDDRLR
jgi:hypothetical protein